MIEGSVDTRPSMDHMSTESFWPWYLQSGRKDGASVSRPRRLLNVLLTCGVLVGWYLWTERTNSFVTTTMKRVAVAHPLCAMGVVLAMLLMDFRGVALDFMAYRVYAVEHIQLRRHIFSSKRKLHVEYERIFGKDRYHRLPEIVAAISVATLSISGIALVFSSR